MPSNELKLQEGIEFKIQEWAVAFDHLPCVVIIHDLKDWSVVYMSARGLKELNVTLDELRSISSEEYHRRFFNPEDAKEYVPQLMGLLERNNNDETVTYFQQVRFADNEDWSWHISGTRLLERDEEGKPLYTITTALPIGTMHHITAKAARLIDEQSFLHQNLQKFSKLTKREKQILKLTVLGKSSVEIAAELFISATTAETHRRNLKNKLQVNTSYELSQYARAFDLI